MSTKTTHKADLKPLSQTLYNFKLDKSEMDTAHRHSGNQDTLIFNKFFNLRSARGLASSRGQKNQFHSLKSGRESKKHGHYSRTGCLS